VDCTEICRYSFGREETLEENLLSAVETHLLNSDVDVGVALSGGLDSSLIAVLCKEIKDDVKTFTISNTKDSEDIYYADRLARRYNFDHTEIIIEEVPEIENLNYILDYVLDDNGGGAFDNAGDLAVFLFYKEVSKCVKVILSGDGADELFGGYWMHRKPLGFKDRLRARLSSSDTVFDRWLDREFPEEDERVGRLNVFKILFDSALPNYHLWTLDRCSMNFGVEARVPYLDMDVISSVLKEDIDKRTGKKLLRKLYTKSSGDFAMLFATSERKSYEVS
jgi:asparagine synthase (glutamine-hydrolysing)